MSDTLIAATRKGLFVFERKAARWQFSHHAFLGDKVVAALTDPRDGVWYAALDLGHFGSKLQRSDDQGRTWAELGVPAYGEDDTVATGDGKPARPAVLELIWTLQAGAANQPGRLWAGTIPGGLFRSDDAGQHWTLQRGLWDRPEREQWFGGGYDAPGIHSICVDPRDSRCIRVAVSCGGVWRSDDDGETWQTSCAGMFATYMPEDRKFDPAIQDPHCMVQCPSAPDQLWVQHHNGIFRSDDGAQHWHEVPNGQPSTFGFAVGVHPKQPKTAWFVPAMGDVRRVPIDAKLVVSRTRDGGETFELLNQGLPQHAYDLVYRHALAVSTDGQRLAIGSTTGGAWISENEGDSWIELGIRLPPVYAMSFA